MTILYKGSLTRALTTGILLASLIIGVNSCSDRKDRNYGVGKSPKNPAALVERAMTQRGFEKIRLLKKAIDEYEIILRENPESPEINRGYESVHCTYLVENLRSGASGPVVDDILKSLDILSRAPYIQNNGLAEKLVDAGAFYASKLPKSYDRVAIAKRLTELAGRINPQKKSEYAKQIFAAYIQSAGDRLLEGTLDSEAKKILLEGIFELERVSGLKSNIKVNAEEPPVVLEKEEPSKTKQAKEMREELERLEKRVGRLERVLEKINQATEN